MPTKCLNKRILFLDVDGVLLGKAGPDDSEIILAKHAAEFLQYCLQNFDCFWLTTHCHDGDSKHITDLMNRYAGKAVMEMVKEIRPVSWRTLKTEAIDVESDFYWIDDAPLWSEILWLENDNVLKRWLMVDTSENPEELKRAISMLENIVFKIGRQ